MNSDDHTPFARWFLRRPDLWAAYAWSYAFGCRAIMTAPRGRPWEDVQ